MLPVAGPKKKATFGLTPRDKLGAVVFLLAVSVVDVLYRPLLGRAEPAVVVEWSDRLLSVHAENVRLSMVLQKVARHAGVELRITGPFDQEMSADFSRLSLETALRRLLVGLNYIIVEKAPTGGRVRSIVVMIAGSRGTAPREASLVTAESTLVGVDSEEDRLAKLEVAAERGDVEELRTATADRNDEIRQRAFDLLVGREPALAARLASTAARSGGITERLTALQVLGRLDSPLSVESIRDALRDGDQGVRECAVEALARQTSDDATSLLREVLADRAPSIRVLALEALARRGTEDHGAVLESTLLQRRLTLF